MPQEWITVKFCRHHGWAKEVAYSPRGLARLVGQMLDEPGRINTIRSQMSAVRSCLHPSGILQKTLEMALRK
jgi:hypothetical protein